MALLAASTSLVSCSRDYSTPESAVKGQIRVLVDLAEAASKCKADDVSPMEKALDELLPEQRKISAALKAMSPEQRQKVVELGKGKYAEQTYVTTQALRVSIGRLGETASPALISGLQPKLLEFQQALAEAEIE